MIVSVPVILKQRNLKYQKISKRGDNIKAEQGKNTKYVRSDHSPKDTQP